MRIICQEPARDSGSDGKPNRLNSPVPPDVTERKCYQPPEIIPGAIEVSAVLAKYPAKSESY